MYDEDDDKDVRMMMMIDKDYDKGSDAADYTLVPLEKQVREGRIFPVPHNSTPSFDHTVGNLIVFNVKLIPTTKLNGGFIGVA